MADNPDIPLDLWDLYRLDLEGVNVYRLAPVRVWDWIERLLTEPWSRFRAKVLGGEKHWRDHVGWGPAEYLSAVLIDATRENTVVTAYHGSKRRPQFPDPYPRPRGKEATRVQSLAELPAEAIEAMVNQQAGG